MSGAVLPWLNTAALEVTGWRGLRRAVAPLAGAKVKHVYLAQKLTARPLWTAPSPPRRGADAGRPPRGPAYPTTTYRGWRRLAAATPN